MVTFFRRTSMITLCTALLCGCTQWRKFSSSQDEIMKPDPPGGNRSAYQPWCCTRDELHTTSCRTRLTQISNSLQIVENRRSTLYVPA